MSHRHRPHLPILAVLLVAAACGAPSSTTPAPSPTSGPGATNQGSSAPNTPGSTPGQGGSPSSQAPLPAPGETLARSEAAAAILRAPTDEARVAAVLGVIRGVNLGVYTPDGEVVLSGGERSETDVWTYDFEVVALAEAIRDGDERDLRDELADLAAFVTAEGGSAITAEDLLAGVIEAARSVSADPGQPRGHALAVAVELARQGRFATDLAAADGSAPIIVDPLTAFLVVADIVLPHVEAEEPPAAYLEGRTAGIDLDVRGVVAQAAANCGTRQSRPRWVAGLAGGRFSGLAGVPNASFDRFLQSRLVGATDVTKLEGPRSWHHLHEDVDGDVVPDPLDAEQLYQFSMRLRGPGAVVTCGLLNGTSLPPGGEIVGATVTWDHPKLDFHGTYERDSMTFATGLANLAVTPNTERWPSAIGPEQTELVDVSAEANVLQALGGDLYTRLAGVPAIQRATVYTDVTWHRNYSVEVDITSVLKATRGPVPGPILPCQGSAMIPSSRSPVDWPMPAGDSVTDTSSRSGQFGS